MKFGRLYTMTVEGRALDPQGNSVVHYIQFPLTVKFQIVKSSTLSAGNAIFRLYNLASDVRADIYKDTFEQLTYKRITFAAGYSGSEMPLVFQGNIMQAFSFREGPDWITEIQALDGGFAIETSQANLTKPALYTLSDLATDVIGQMDHVSIGAIGALDMDRPLPFRGVTLCGNAWDLIARAIMPVGGYAFINNERVFILQQWEFLQNQGSLDVIDEDAGLIGTPKLQANLIRARMLFEPRLEILQQVQLATLQSRMNGTYTVLRLAHQGTISGAFCDELVTEVTLYQPERAFAEVAA